MKGINTHPSHIPYRADVDGLRALAVLCVLVYHAFPKLLPGGFVGVDVFFVISGYLITSIIVDELASGSFSFLRFYIRRVCRLFPALIAVIVTSIACGLFFLQADEFAALIKQVAVASFFVSNIFFLRESGYFDNSADTKPLLHLWSLSIEEQFYLCWPILLVLVWRLKRNYLTASICILISISFVYNILLANTEPVLDFFWLPTRAWELIAGALTACVARHSLTTHTDAGYLKPLLLRAGAPLGLTIVLIAAIGFDHNTIYPGWAAVAPVLGASLILFSKSTDFVNARVLGSPVLSYIGRISYPLYLWHWPILVFARITLSAVPVIGVRFFLLLLAGLLAIFTFHFIELPIKGICRKQSKFAYALLALLITIGGGCWLSYSRQVGVDRAIEIDTATFEDYFFNDTARRSLETFESAFRHDCNFYQVEKYYAGETTQVPKDHISDSCFTPSDPNKKTLLIWGDSHAQMLNFGLKETLPTQSWQILQVASSGCYPSVDFSDDSTTNYCARSNWFALNVVKKFDIDTVVIAQSTGHNLSQMIHIAKTLHSLGVKHIVLMGPAPRWTDRLPRIMLRQLANTMPERTLTGVEQAVIETNETFKRSFPRSSYMTYVDVIGVFCNVQGCLTRIGDDRIRGLTSWDLGHLSQSASRYLAEKLLTPVITNNTW